MERRPYKIQYTGKPLVLESRLGFEPEFNDRFAMTNTTTIARD